MANVLAQEEAGGQDGARREDLDSEDDARELGCVSVMALQS